MPVCPLSERLNAAVTPAVRALEAAGVPFTVHEYRHDPAAGVRAGGGDRRSGSIRTRSSRRCSSRRDGDEHAVAIVPVSCQLSLKAVGGALGRKRVEMCDPAVAQRVTGYVLGGISPFGQRKQLPTVIDETCVLHAVVYVSGGRAGSISASPRPT